MTHDNPQRPLVSRDEFAKLMIEALQHAGVHYPITYLPDDFRLTINGPYSLEIVNLRDAYDEYCAAPVDQRNELLCKHASESEGPEDPPDSWARARPYLLARVRSRASMDRRRLEDQTVGRTRKPVERLIADHLAMELVCCSPTGHTVLEEKDLQRWGVTQDLAMNVALDNLHERTRPAFTAVLPGLHVLEGKDSFDATCVLLPELMAGLQLKGDPVAILPNPGILMVTGAADDDGLETMAKMANDYDGGEHFISTIPIRWDGQAWHTYLLKPDHTHYGLFHECHLKTRLWEYSRQRKLLVKIHPGAYLSFLMSSDEEHVSDIYLFCDWEIASPCILPRAEKILFMRKSNAHFVPGMVDWCDFEAACGHLLTPLGVYPECYLALTAPTSGQLKAAGWELA